MPSRARDKRAQGGESQPGKVKKGSRFSRIETRYRGLHFFSRRELALLLELNPGAECIDFDPKRPPGKRLRVKASATTWWHRFLSKRRVPEPNFLVASPPLAAGTVPGTTAKLRVRLAGSGFDPSSIPGSPYKERQPAVGLPKTVVFAVVQVDSHPSQRLISFGGLILESAAPQQPAAAEVTPSVAVRLESLTKLPSPPLTGIKSVSVTLDVERLNKWTIKAMRGEARSRSQAQVFNGFSARLQVEDLQARCKLPQKLQDKFELGHLSAASFGGIDGVDPQVIENLVVMTAACNTWMMVAEDVVRQLINTGLADTVSLNVTATLIPGTHVDKTIHYGIAWGENNYVNFELSGLTRTPPTEQLLAGIMQTIYHELEQGRAPQLTVKQTLETPVEELIEAAGKDKVDCASASAAAGAGFAAEDTENTAENVTTPRRTLTL